MYGKFLFFVLVVGIMMIGNHNLQPCPNGMFSIDSVCTACPPGRGGASCLLCAAGTYKNVWGVSECDKCQPGTYSLVIGATGEHVCQACVQGTYTIDNVNCLACPLNTISPSASGSILDCMAKAGYYGLPGQAATICPAGSYCPASIMKPIPCPLDFVSEEGSRECFGSVGAAVVGEKGSDNTSRNWIIFIVWLGLMGVITVYVVFNVKEITRRQVINTNIF